MPTFVDFSFTRTAPDDLMSKSGAGVGHRITVFRFGNDHDVLFPSLGKNSREKILMPDREDKILSGQCPKSFVTFVTKTVGELKESQYAEDQDGQNLMNK
jgi:hypothetical protein